MKTWAKERWLDMGLATIIFTVHTDRQGRYVADVYELVNVYLLQHVDLSLGMMMF
jgi:hypothetical protein